MYRYLCQLCYTIVTYGERHPCFFYKDDDYVYSVPQQGDNGNAGLKEEPERLPENVNESSFNQFPAAQQNNTYQSRPLCGRLAESDRHDENTFNTKISDSLQNIYSPFAHSTEIQTTIFGNSSENCKPNHRTDDSASGAKRTKSSEKCRLSNDTRLNNKSVHGKQSSIKNLKSHIKRTQLSSGDNCEASISIPRVIFRKEFEGANVISNADSVDSAVSLNSPEGTSEVLSASGPSTSTIEDSRHFMRDSSRVSGNSSVNMQFTKDHVKGKFLCNVCHKEYDKKCKLVIHYRIHTGEKPFECNVCNKAFSLKTDLKRHSLTHTGEKPFVCDVCPKRFSRNGQLTRHYRLHTGEKIYVCDVCGTRSSYKHQLDCHKSEKHQY